MTVKAARTSQGLRDVLFDEIDELRGPNADPSKSLAVASVAKQIINTAKAELEFHRVMAERAEAGNPVELGTMQLGSTDAAQSAATAATGH
jgi:hypothetical protein